MKIKAVLLFCLFFIMLSTVFFGQEKGEKKTAPRKIHYVPDGDGFLLKNGSRKFNRALYGSNTAFRVETGDLPEFAMYMPGMGGNLKLGLSNGKSSKWITEASSISARYANGKMYYEIQDAVLGRGKLKLEIAALKDEEGLVLKVSGLDIDKKASLIWAFGGASGRKFSRDGDIGADPESGFYLKPEYCTNNQYTINKDSFVLEYGSEVNKQKAGNDKSLLGMFPSSEVHLANAEKQNSPLELFASAPDKQNLIVGKISSISKTDLYWSLNADAKSKINNQTDLARLFTKTSQDMKELASRVKVTTPDPYINTLGSALAIAADGIWESPAYLHGAVAWRMHLNAWRGAYTADPLGWHDRAKTHFTSYSHSQVTQPLSGPVVFDAERNMARQKEEMGTSMFSSGYISRKPDNNTIAHHYDMNLVFFDQMLRHFKWTGDTEFMKEMWPVLQRHLDWEKRNFDVDNDGLYDSYASIWASDALQYSGGGVIHSSAYNYYSNKTAATIASALQQNPNSFTSEADKIAKATANKLWLPEKGIFAEYKDAMGRQLLHETPGIWSIYHTIDSELADPFQNYQMLRYVDTQIPHIPIQAEGLDKNDLYVIGTTNWQPYTWSINNVALAEQLHTSLAYWQGGNSEKAFKMWESALVESMYLSPSPGGFEQLMHQDAIRGELYRDFADPIGMASRTLVEGLFGIQPDALAHQLTIKPGFPEKWDSASLEIPDISFSFKREKNTDSYEITNRLASKMDLKFIVNSAFEKINSVTINGNKANYTITKNGIGKPEIIIETPFSEKYSIVINWDTKALEEIKTKEIFNPKDAFVLGTKNAKIIEVYDPQKVLSSISKTENKVTGIVNSIGDKTLFVQLQQGEMIWWKPVAVNCKPRFEVTVKEVNSNDLLLFVQNNSNKTGDGNMLFNSLGNEIQQAVSIKASSTETISIPLKNLITGTNNFQLKTADGEVYPFSFISWDIPENKTLKAETVSLAPFFNAKVTDIFKQKYESPRPKTPTLQLPLQGIGNWCYPMINPEIDDSGLRAKAKATEKITTPEGIVFETPSDAAKNNIVFTSMWDNYPEKTVIPLKGKASHLYLMLAGSTNPMQSRMTNGKVIVNYTDDSSEELELKNPENWWPIEQDYFVDGLAFTTNAPKPPRVYLKSGIISRTFNDYKAIKGFANNGIDGGAGTILDLPLNTSKTLKSFSIQTIANDVVIGLMSATLIR
ncbi:DUF4450 domain-containing protein [Flavobacterium marginilacus]|uniref:DUF4450 domain-containing protein n=1 Tax=Flavobacterium marginilacus TaxID=3003256 RepID=UPI00248E6C64|nr:DUF4450 domain-containing protein [Flavobacterium marginilacus]